ncbi:unnamed protein product [Scytosiphon promiscuus]
MANVNYASPTAARDIMLLKKVEKGDVRRVEAMLAAGASVDGPAVPTYEIGRPLMAAVTSGNIKMTKCLISNGADVDAPSPLKLSDPEGRMFLCRGVRAVHVAVVNAMPQQLEVLLDAGADPNIAHSEGVTPLMATCQMMRPGERVDMARQLLEAGANPNVQDPKGWLPLFYASCHEEPEVMELLLSFGPATVHHVASDGSTPLYMASGFGKERLVSLLLSAGAKQPPSGLATTRCPLDIAVTNNNEAVVRVLLDRGLGAIGGSRVLPNALNLAVMRKGRTRILRMLLAAEGEARRQHWARVFFEVTPMLGWAVASNRLEEATILLEAGADESVPDGFGRKPSTIIALHLEPDERNKRTEAAIRRLLERAPAMRARSWAWPAGARAAPTPRKASTKTVPPVRIYLPEGRKRFVWGASRYAKKR